MSKRWNTSQQVKKENIDAAVLTEDEPMGGFMSYREKEVTRPPSPSPRKTASVGKIFFTLILLSLIALNAQLFILAQRYVVKIDGIEGKIDGIQDSVSAQSDKVSGLSRNILSVSSKQSAFEDEFVAVKNKVLALEDRQESAGDIDQIKSSLANIESRLAVLAASDERQQNLTEELRDKSDRLIRKFTLYDMELRSVTGQ
jgi:septal ring factor EnvC (AmiA/AmiB activator)